MSPSNITESAFAQALTLFSHTTLTQCTACTLQTALLCLLLLLLLLLSPLADSINLVALTRTDLTTMDTGLVLFTQAAPSVPRTSEPKLIENVSFCAAS